MEAAAIALTSIILTLRSMNELIPKSTKPATKKTDRKLCLVVENEKIQLVTETICSYLRQNTNQVVTVEKLLIDSQKTEYILILENKGFNHFSQNFQLIPIDEIWTAQWQQNYIVGQEDDYPVKPVAVQYTISYKYENLYYLSEQHVFPKPSNYFITGIDQFKWKHIVNRKHLEDQQLVLKDKLSQKILS
jgi:hypothetical protein